MKEKPQSTKVQFHCPAELWAQFQRQAEAQGTTASHKLRMLMTAELKKEGGGDAR